MLWVYLVCPCLFFYQLFVACIQCVRCSWSHEILPLVSSRQRSGVHDLWALLTSVWLKTPPRDQPLMNCSGWAKMDNLPKKLMFCTACLERVNMYLRVCALAQNAKSVGSFGLKSLIVYFLSLSLLILYAASVCDRVQWASGSYSDEGSDWHHEAKEDLSIRTVQQWRGRGRLTRPSYHQETRRYQDNSVKCFSIFWYLKLVIESIVQTNY